MKNIITQIIIVLCCIHIAHANNDNKCEEILGAIMIDASLTEEQKLDEWYRYKSTCLQNDIYYLGHAYIRAQYDLTGAIDYLNDLLKNNVIFNTKDALFSLGTAYDVKYAFTHDEKILDALLITANRLIEVNPNSGKGLFLKSCYYLHKNKLNLVNKYYEKISNKSDAELIKPLINRKCAIILYKQNDFEGCIRLYDIAFSIDEFRAIGDFFATNAATSALIKTNSCERALNALNIRKKYFPKIVHKREFIVLENEYKSRCGTR